MEHSSDTSPMLVLDDETTASVLLAFLIAVFTIHITATLSQLWSDTETKEEKKKKVENNIIWLFVHIRGRSSATALP